VTSAMTEPPQLRASKCGGHCRKSLGSHSWTPPKCPTFDFLVELVGAGKKQLFFFVQVKATREGYTKGKEPRLKVSVSKEDVRTMVLYPAPTYIVGIDEVSEAGFLVAVFGSMKKSISSMSTRHRLDCATLRLLWEEVRDYWRGRKMAQKKSRFPN
jgi:hypothetical protein